MESTIIISKDMRSYFYFGYVCCIIIIIATLASITVKLAGWHQLGTTCPLPLGHLATCLAPLSFAWMLAYK
jgi:uncharacterized protein (DUF983 family)